MMDLEIVNENRFYKLIPEYQKRCSNKIENLYKQVKECNGLLWMQMKNGSINLRCRHVGCLKEYEIKRYCSYCEKEYDFEDITCDNCEPVVINIATWKVSIDECNKAIKKVNRAFKQDLIDENEWKNVIAINKDEVDKCQKNLEKAEKDLGLSIN